MIECLSNPCWINPQIDFLLFLQQIRIGHFDIFDKFFLSVTVFGEFWLPTLICAITYWCIDFKAGIYLFTLEGTNILFAHLFKMLACVYRPWVLNDKLCPSSLAVPYAKGYSFPSGHSIMSSSILGGTAFLLRKNPISCSILVFIILLVGFSRLWLGVHTPQDVICGLLIGLFLIFTVNKLINWAELNKNRYLYIACFVNIIAIIALIFICFFNTYRVDYVDGELLVNPQNLKYITCVVYGYALGLLNGCCICRRFFPYNPKNFSVKTRIYIGLVGICLIISLLKYVLKYIIMNILPIKIAFIITFAVGIVITLIYPMLFQKFVKIIRSK